ncbi:MAG: helix-turn-helix domain-containing protein [Deltaproteobacteria bacterium]|nr:helix-turn-helix domain-containing protein [Deltaproteobacteria bacterium]
MTDPGQPVVTMTLGELAELVRDVVRAELGAREVDGAVEPMLTTADAAEALQVHEATVRKWIRAGELEAKNFGSALRIRRDSLEEFMRRGTRGSEAA